jgi:oxepin-CoA hydrolase/3-oxo-5,6-dehydrosuberyl-CoA semialdehyde dehydrogenase
MKNRPALDMNVSMEDFLSVHVPNIIKKIIGNEKAQWGIMNVHEMVEHLIFPLNFVSMNPEMVIITPLDKIENQHLFLKSEFGMPKNFKFYLLPEDRTLPIIYPDLNEAKQKLNEAIEKFLNTINSPQFTKKTHPIFGKLNREEWLIFQYKHFTHHFTQFGLL